MHLLVIDNYDPEIATLIGMLEAAGATVSVYRNDEIEVEEIHELAPDRIVISHGADTPAEAGITLPLIREFAVVLPILGLGLGHLAVGMAFGARMVAPDPPFSASSVAITHTADGVFAGVVSPLAGVLVGDEVVERATLPSSLEATAWTADGLIMGLRHATQPVVGWQFFPDERIYRRMLTNFLQMIAIPLP